MPKKNVARKQGVLFAEALMPSRKEISEAIGSGPRGTQLALSRELGVSEVTVSLWKNGKQFPSYEKSLVLIGWLRGRGLLE